MKDEYPVKQVIVIRRDLKMRRGKEIAQGSHASLAFLTTRLHTVQIDESNDKRPIYGTANISKAELQWIRDAFTKVCCRVDSEAELDKVYEDAKAAGLEVHLIEDSGRTEFGGVPTKTCLAIGPDYCDKIDKVTGNLELY